MKKAWLVGWIWGGSLMASVAVLAQDGEALYTAKGCQACHRLEGRLVGPSYQEVAARYVGQTDALAQIAERIQKGSRGVWGPIPMPPNAAVSDEEAHRLAEWILNRP